MTTKVCLAGISGWTGSCVGRAIVDSDDLVLTGAVARATAGQDVGEVLGLPPEGASIKVSATVAEALEAETDVFVDYTSAESVKGHVMLALSRGIPVVIGSSGLSSEDFAEIEKEANRQAVGVIACGNFAITAALAKRFALMAAQHLPQWEIIDYAHAEKKDAPSGTAREIADQLAKVKENVVGYPIDKIIGNKEARGAQVQGTPIHSVRLPGFVFGFETIFGLPDQRLIIKHDAGSGAGPYVDGTLLAIRKIAHVRGLIRGMDTLIFDVK